MSNSNLWRDVCQIYFIQCFLTTLTFGDKIEAERQVRKMTEQEKRQYLESFGSRVRAYREKLEMSQRELGRRAGYVDGANPASSISKIENGQMDIPQTKVADLAKALGVEPYDLILSPQVARLVKYAEAFQKGESDVEI